MFIPPSVSHPLSGAIVILFTSPVSGFVVAASCCIAGYIHILKQILAGKESSPNKIKVHWQVDFPIQGIYIAVRLYNSRQCKERIKKVLQR